jgi:hypothetical protein
VATASLAGGRGGTADEDLCNVDGVASGCGGGVGEAAPSLLDVVAAAARCCVATLGNSISIS